MSVWQVHSNLHEGSILTCFGESQRSEFFFYSNSIQTCISSTGQYAGQSGLFRRPRHDSLPDLELRYLQCTCCWRSQVPVGGFETLNATLSSASEPCKEDSNRTLDACYTTEQRGVILQVLNNASPSDLADVKLLRGRKSLNIVEYRTKNGPFKTLESVVNVPLLKHKSAVKIFNSILNPVKKERKVRIQLAKFIRPEIDRSWLEVRFCFYVCTFNGPIRG